MQALKKQVAELSASHATREEVQALRASSGKLTKKIRNLETALGGNGGSGSGSGSGLVQMQMYADFREQYKDKVNYLDGESMEHGFHIGNLLKRMAVLEEQSQQYEEVLRTHGLPSPKRARSNNSGMDSRRRRNDLENLCILHKYELKPYSIARTKLGKSCINPKNSTCCRVNVIAVSTVSSTNYSSHETSPFSIPHERRDLLPSL
jgi:hypothetical protein